MIMNKFGFKIKIEFTEKIDIIKVEDWIKKYQYYFQIIQFKLKFKNVNEEIIRKILGVMNLNFGTNCFFHMNSKNIQDENFIEELNFYMRNAFFKKTLIVHIDETDYNQKIDNIESILDDKTILCLENVDRVDDIYKYFGMIESIFDRKSSHKIYFCLDLGHALNHLVFDYENFLSYLNSKKKLLKKIKLIHLHDFNGIEDHLKIGEGILNIESVKKFLLINSLIEVPIILEIPLLELQEGVKEIRKIYHDYSE